MGLTLANRITIARIFLIPFFIGSVLYYTPQNDHFRLIALGIFLVAMITDLIDGYIARKWHQKTQAGALLDPLADKLLLISAFICLTKIGVHFETVRFPIWFVVIVISRDVILLIGSTILHLTHSDVEIEASYLGKATTFLESLSIIGVLLQWGFSLYIWWITVVFAVLSTVAYIKIGIIKLEPERSGTQQKDLDS